MVASGMTPCVPLVSVCIANYNGMAVIDDCLKSVLNQAGDIVLEILVHDDASSDGSAAYIRNRYPTARLIESKTNVGFCVSNNRMVAEAAGEYLLLLNNDAALWPDALQTLLSEAHQLKQAAILGLPQYDATSGELIDIGSMFDPFLNPVPNLDKDRNDVGMVIGACLWLPRTLWAKLGGFPEWFDTVAEDMYLCVRARLAGYPVRAIERSGFRHVVGHSLGGGKVTMEKRLVTSVRRRACSERNKSFVMVLTYPAPLFQVIFPLHLVLLLLEGATLALVKRERTLFEGIYVACLYSLWRERGRLVRLRRKIQAEKTISLNLFLSVFRMMPHKLQMLLRHGLPHLN
jgi:GT2 family glycosyltransferase